MRSGLWFSVLGPLRAWRDGVELDLGSPQQRSVLAVLLVAAGRPVSVAELVDAVWGSAPPANAVNAVHRNIGLLRRTFEPELGTRQEGRWLHRSGGSYRLRVDADSLDLLRFRQLAAGDEVVAALALWQGACGDGLPELPVFVAVNGERVAAARRAADLALAEGVVERVLPGVASAAETALFDEALQARLVRMLAAAGRQGEAFEVYRRVRDRLVGELGVDPGPELAAAHAAILRPEPAPASVLVPAQLPADPAVFVGRRAELARLLSLHQPATNVAIGLVVGMAGAGKTTLAVHWAHQVAARYPDGQLYANLRGFDPSEMPTPVEDVLRGFLGALGVPGPAIPADVDSQAALFRTLLTGRRVLVLLDNARDEAQVRPLLPGTAGCLVIVTSRDRLGGLVAVDGAVPVSLPPLSDADSHDLLTRRVGAERMAGDPVAAGEIVALCGGLPLALAIVAARSAIQSGFPLAAIAASLRDAHVLDAFDEVTADVRAVFSWSYRAVSPAAARLFRLLALHPGPHVSASAVAAIAGATVRETRVLLAELCRAHLLSEPRPGRYARHDLLSAYATELLDEVDSQDERDAATVRMLGFYLHSTYAASRMTAPDRRLHGPAPLPAGVVPVAPESRDQALAWLTEEVPNLHAVLDRTVHSGHGTVGWQLVSAVFSFLCRAGGYARAIELLTMAMAFVERDGELLARADLTRDLGYTSVLARRLPEARGHLEAALRLYEQAGDALGQGHTHRYLGLVAEFEKRYDEMAAHAFRAVDILRATGVHGPLSTALNMAGWACALREDFARTITLCSEALAIQEQLGLTYAFASTLDSIGFAHHHLGHHEEAVRCYDRALVLLAEHGDRNGEPIVLANLADTRLAMGDRAAARAGYERALALHLELSLPGAQRLEVAELRAKLAGLGAGHPAQQVSPV